MIASYQRHIKQTDGQTYRTLLLEQYPPMHGAGKYRSSSV